MGRLRAADAAKRPEAEKAVMDAVKDADARNNAVRTAAYAARAGEIRSILNADQVNKLAGR